LFLASSKSYKYPFNKTSIGREISQDSGYIYKNNIFQIIAIDHNDTLFRGLDENDTIGKYYKGRNGHYFSCIEQFEYGYPCYFLFESLSDRTIISREFYCVGMNNCCWNNRFDGFMKYGDYISFKECGTGSSAHCSSHLHLFKALKPQGEQGVITTTSYSWTGRKNKYRELSSEFKITGDTAIVHYKLQLVKQLSKKEKILSRKNFTIKYIMRGDKWKH
jgi:hypothetical protein